MSADPKSLTLGIFPASQALGWIVFEGPFAPYDWGFPHIGREKNRVCLKRIEAIIAKYQPHTLVLEAFERRHSKRQDRITRLCRAIVALAAERGLDVAIYTREDVRACFQHLGAHSRQEVAEAVARHVDALRPSLPRPRKQWESERRSMALFSAAALVLTHYQLSANNLLDQLA